MEETCFNLQITVARLEEELSLYRNGTNSQELFELVGEKEVEIADLKSKVELLRKVARSSGDVLSRCDSLEKENQCLLELNASCEKETLEARATAADASAQLVKAKTLTESLQSTVDIDSEKITGLNQHVQELNNDVDKLQQRCAGLVAEKMEKNKQLENEKKERAAQVRELRDELERAMRFVLEMKATVNKERSELQTAKAKLMDETTAKKAIQASNDSSSKVYLMRIANLEAELLTMANEKILARSKDGVGGVGGESTHLGKGLKDVTNARRETEML